MQRIRVSHAFRCAAGLFGTIAFAALTRIAVAQVVQFGDQDLCNTGAYSTNPTQGASLQGLLPGAITPGAAPTPHGFPFSPAGDYPGMDEIYVGSTQTGGHDGYSGFSGRHSGPLQLTLDYSSLVPLGSVIETLTLGLAFDDFQQAVFGQPYLVRLNGQAYSPLNALASSLNQTGPVTQFFSIGLPVSLLTPSNNITITIDQGGDGGDGFAIDFATVGITTIPAPSALLLLTSSMFVLRRRR